MLLRQQEEVAFFLEMFLETGLQKNHKIPNCRQYGVQSRGMWVSSICVLVPLLLEVLLSLLVV